MLLTGRPSPEVERSVRTAVSSLVTGEPSALTLFTEDVTGASPLVRIHGREELRAQLADRRDGLSDVEVHIDVVTGDDDEVVVTWRFCGDHTGPIFVNEDTLFEPSGRRLQASVVTRFTLRDGRICAFTSEYDPDVFR